MRCSAILLRRTFAANFAYARASAPNTLFAHTAILSGNKIAPHPRFKKKTRRQWRPNVQRKNWYSAVLGQHVRVRATRKTWRTVEKFEREVEEMDSVEGQRRRRAFWVGANRRSAFDLYLLRTSERRLGPWGMEMKSKIIKKEFNKSPEGRMARVQRQIQAANKSSFISTKKQVLAHFLPMVETVLEPVSVNRKQNYRPSPSIKKQNLTPTSIPEPEEPKGFFSQATSTILSWFGVSPSTKDTRLAYEEIDRLAQTREKSETEPQRRARVAQSTQKFQESLFAKKGADLASARDQKRILRNPFEVVRDWMGRNTALATVTPSPTKSFSDITESKTKADGPVGVDDWASLQVERERNQFHEWAQKRKADRVQTNDATIA